MGDSAEDRHTRPRGREQLVGLVPVGPIIGDVELPARPVDPHRPAKMV